jgi:glycine cleavage system H protein
MSKWKAVRVKQELVEQVKEEVKKNKYSGLSEFVSEAIQQRLQTLTKQRVTEYLERDQIVRNQLLQDQIFYTSKHIWARNTQKGEIEVGITSYFQDKLKEIVNVQTEALGQKVTKNKPFGMVESWWFTYDLYSPVNGEVVSINKKILDDPFLLNADPDLWIIKIQPEPTDTNSWTTNLLNPQEYEKAVKEDVEQLIGSR